jgi:hypothetical protein
MQAGKDFPIVGAIHVENPESPPQEDASGGNCPYLLVAGGVM